MKADAIEPFSGKILIVDNSNVVRKSLDISLQKAGYNTETASSGKEALEKIETTNPNLVLLDIHMPDKTGFDLLKEIRANPASANIPVIMLTAMSEIENRVQAFTIGADDYILKPYDPDELLARISRLLKTNAYNSDLRKASEEKSNYIAQLKKSEERYRTVSEMTSDYAASIRVEPDGKLTREWGFGDITQITGYQTPGTDVFSEWESMVHPDDLPLFRNRLRYSLTDKFFSYEFRIMNIRGEVCWVNFNSHPEWDNERGRIVRFFVALRDITEHKRAEEALQAEKDKTRNYLDMATVLIVATTGGGRVTLVNKKGCEVLGYKEDEILGKNWVSNFVPVYAREELISTFSEVMAGKSEMPEIHYNPILTREGKERNIAWHNTLLKNIYGDVTGIISSGLDITEQILAEEALKESVARYRLLAENVTDVIWTADLNLNFTYLSPSVKSLLDYSPDEVMGITSDKFLAPESFKTVMEAFQRELEIEQKGEGERGRPLSIELELVHRDGTTVWSETKAGYLRDREGRPTGVLGVTRDASERKRADEALRESEERYRIVSELMSDYIFKLDVDTHGNINVVFITESFLLLTGYTLREIQTPGKWVHLVHPDDYPKVKSFLGDLLTSGQSNEIECRVFRKDRDLRWINVCVYALWDNREKRVNSFIVAVKDITEHKRAGEALRESEERFRQIAEISPFPISIIDTGGRYLFVNRKFTEIFGYTLDDIPTGRDWFRLAFPDPEYRKNVISVWKNDTCNIRVNEARSRTFKVRCKHGEARDVTLRLVTMDDGKNLVVYEDITERMQVEKFMAIQHELEIAVASTTDMKEALKLILKSALEIGGLDSGGIYLIDSDTGDLDLMVHDGLSPQFIEVISHFSAYSHRAKLVMKGEPAYTSYQKLISDPDEIRKQEGLRFIAVIPIKHKDKVIAVLFLASHLHYDITRLSRDAIESIASNVGGIIARNKMEELLKRSEEKFSLAFHASPTMMAITGLKDGRYIDFNESALKTMGFKRDEAIGKTALELGLFPYIEESEKLIKLIREKGIIKNVEVHLRTKSGEERLTLFSGEIIDLNGEKCLVAAVDDITERKRMEEALLRASQEWRETFDAMTDIVMLIDKNHRILRTNKAAINSFGMSFKELLGQHCYKVINNSDEMPDLSFCKKSAAESKSHEFEHFVEKIDKYYYCTLSPIKDDSESITGFILVLRDITEFKEMQKELQNKQRLATIGEVAGGIAHEIKNPLFAISSGVQILQDELQLSDDQKQTLDTIFKETMRADRLIRQLLVFSARQELKRSAHNLPALIDQTVSLYQGHLKSKGINIHKNVSPDAPQAFVDKDKISQVLINLVQNAIEASKPGDTIIIELDLDHNRNKVIIKVGDMGPGIPESDRERVFDLFHSTKKGSTGMGLAISKKIIEDHNGEIWVEERKGGGAVFVIELPVLLKNEQHNTNS